jgi:hypothetical protein
MLTLLLKGVPKKFEHFLIEDFFDLSPVSTTHRWYTLSCEYLRELSKKFEIVIMGYWDWGETDL